MASSRNFIYEAGRVKNSYVLRAPLRTFDGYTRYIDAMGGKYFEGIQDFQGKVQRVAEWNFGLKKIPDVEALLKSIVTGILPPTHELPPVVILDLDDMPPESTPAEPLPQLPTAPKKRAPRAKKQAAPKFAFPKNLDFDPTEKELGETNRGYVDRVDRYNELRQRGLSEREANMLSRAKTNMDEIGVGYPESILRKF